MLVPLSKAAEALGGISIWTLRKHIGRGNVRVTHLGRRVFLDQEEMSRITKEGLPPLRIRANSEGPKRGGCLLRVHDTETKRLATASTSGYDNFINPDQTIEKGTSAQ